MVNKQTKAKAVLCRLVLRIGWTRLQRVRRGVVVTCDESRADAMLWCYYDGYSMQYEMRDEVKSETRC